MMKFCLSWVVLLGMIEILCSANLRADDLINLRVSENGRFLIHQDGSGFFPIADTAWAIAWKLDRKQVETYLQRRKEQKFNTIAIIAFPSFEGKVVIPNAYGDLAFEVSKRGAWDSRHPITTPGENPDDSTQYDYWDHLEYIIDSAESKGMCVVLLPAWGVCVAGDWGSGKVTRDVIFNASNGYQYSRWIGQRFKSKKNIIWMIGGDRNAVYGNKDYRNVFRAMAEGVADGVNGIDQQDGKADYSTTLMSYHPRKWQPNSSEWFHNEPWLDFNSIQDQPSDQVTATTLDFGLTPIKPTWLFEGGYEFRRNTYKEWQIRFQSYQTVFAGGFGVTYGSMNICPFGEFQAAPDEPITITNSRNWKISMDEAGAMDMQHLFRLMTSMSKEQFVDRIPDQSLIEGDQGSMTGNEGIISTRLQATRGNKGDYAFIYSANGRDISVKMSRLSAPRMNAYWFNPRNGMWRVQKNELTEQRPFINNIPSGPDAPTRKFDPPGSAKDGNDWVLVLKLAE